MLPPNWRNCLLQNKPFFSPGRWAVLEIDACCARSYCSQARIGLMVSTTTTWKYFPHLEHLPTVQKSPLAYSENLQISTSDKPLQIQLTHISEKHQDPTRNLPVYSPTLTAEFCGKTQDLKVQPTKQGTISCLAFGKDYLNVTNATINHLLYSQSLPPKEQ